MWRRDVKTWLQQCTEDVLCLQETHLTGENLHKAQLDMHKAGFRKDGGDAMASKKGPQQQRMLHLGKQEDPHQAASLVKVAGLSQRKQSGRA